MTTMNEHTEEQQQTTTKWQHTQTNVAMTNGNKKWKQQTTTKWQHTQTNMTMTNGNKSENDKTQTRWKMIVMQQQKETEKKFDDNKN